MNGWSSPRIIPTSATERSEGMRLAYTWVGRPSTSSVTTSNIPPGPVSWARTSSIVGMGGTVAASAWTAYPRYLESEICG